MKIISTITARLKSTRLKKKIIKELMNKKLIEHLIDRLKLSKKINQIVLCTSNLIDDDPLGMIASKNNINCYQGHPDDVLLRIKNASKHNNGDIIFSCTADNPLIDIYYVDKLIDFHIKNNNDYSKIIGLPIGTYGYVLSYNALEKACELKEENDTEIWGPFFTETNEFKCGELIIENMPDIRLTVDTPEDFELIEKIFENLYNDNSLFDLNNIIKLINEKPELLKINNNIQQTKSPQIIKNSNTNKYKNKK